MKQREETSEKQKQKKKMFYLIRFSTKAHEKVIRFDIPMQKSFGMHKFYSGYLYETKKDKHSDQNTFHVGNKKGRKLQFSQE